MTFAHAAEAGDGDGQLGGVRGGHCGSGRGGRLMGYSLTESVEGEF